MGFFMVDKEYCEEYKDPDDSVKPILTIPNVPYGKILGVLHLENLSRHGKHGPGRTRILKRPVNLDAYLSQNHFPIFEKSDLPFDGGFSFPADITQMEENDHLRENIRQDMPDRKLWEAIIFIADSESSKVARLHHEANQDRPELNQAELVKETSQIKKVILPLPKLRLDLLYSFFLSAETMEAIVGDLDECYEIILHKEGKSQANRWYTNQIITSLPPLIWAAMKKPLAALVRKIGS